jgi:carbamoyl-phosphate synthase large subunit
MNKISVLVTGIGGGSHGEQVLKSLRLVTDFDLEIVGTDLTDFSAGRLLVDHFYIVPNANDPEFKNILFDIVEKHNIKFIYHGSEPELKFLSLHRDEIEAKGIGLPLNSDEIIKLCMNKHKTYLKMSELGIPIPRFLKIDSIDDFKKVDFFPLILKPSTGSGGSAGVYLILDFEELNLIGKYLLKQNMDIIAQEYIGDKDCEYTIGVSSDKDGQVLGSIIVKRMINNALTTHRKISANGKEYIISSGISQGVILHDHSISDQAENIARCLGSVGPLNIQARVVNGLLMLFEINPRLSGTTSLRAIAGYNEPEFLLKKHLGISVSFKTKYNHSVILRTIQEVLI